MNNLHEEALSKKDFYRISNFVYQYSGIKLVEVKSGMVEGRLRKRLKVLGVETYKKYTDFVLSAAGKDEVIYLIDCLTTNKTDFFRENQHFEYLVGTVLPELVRQGVGRQRPLRIWSAGCSSGEEPYTLSMVLHEWNRTHPPIDFEILATDLSISVLKKAATGKYTEQNVAPIPLELRKRYFLRGSTDTNSVKVSPEIRKVIKFGLLNLKDESYKVPHKLDIIFCRNVLIYFDKETIENIINKFCSVLVPGGVLCLGHSESINGLNVPLDAIGPTTYRKR